MRRQAYIGLFRARGRGDWHVCFPDLVGCEATGKSFKEVLDASRSALAEFLNELGDPKPRPRSTAELLIDAQRDALLSSRLAQAVMHHVEPREPDEGLAPLALVAAQARRGGGDPPHLGG